MDPSDETPGRAAPLVSVVLTTHNFERFVDAAVDSVLAQTWADFELTELDETFATWAGPAVSWAPTAALWVTTTAGFGLNDRADKLSVRAIFGLSL